MANYYCVVRFSEENSVAVISSAWLLGDFDRAYWPSTSVPNKITKLAKYHSRPEKDWKIHKCEILKTYGKCVI